MMRIVNNLPRIAPGLLAAAALCLSAAGCRRTPPPDAGGVRQEAAPPAEPNTVRLSEDAVRTGGIAVEPARVVETDRCVSGVGELRFNDRRLAHLTARAAGRLESVAAFRGDRVVRGQALA